MYATLETNKAIIPYVHKTRVHGEVSTKLAGKGRIVGLSTAGKAMVGAVGLSALIAAGTLWATRDNEEND